MNFEILSFATKHDCGLARPVVTSQDDELDIGNDDAHTTTLPKEEEEEEEEIPETETPVTPVTEEPDEISDEDY